MCRTIQTSTILQKKKNSLKRCPTLVFHSYTMCKRTQISLAKNLYFSLLRHSLNKSQTHLQILKMCRNNVDQSGLMNFSILF